MKTIQRLNLIAALACGLGVGLMGPRAAQAQDDEPIGNEYRQTLSFYHPVKNDLTGFAHLDYRNNFEEDYRAYQVLWPGLTYSVKDSLQLSGGLLTRNTDNQQGADTLELRPFAGVKLFMPNASPWNIYNYTRYEFRDIQDLDTHAWTSYSRVRSRFGVEFPLASRAQAWQPKTWYALADAEPFFRFDQDTLDPFRVRGGIAYIVSRSVRVEFIYTAQFTRSASHNDLAYTGNNFRLNIRIGHNQGILHRLFDGSDADD